MNKTVTFASSWLRTLLGALALITALAAAAPVRADDAVVDPDQAITARVEAVLKADSKLVSPAPIGVSTKDGVVSLSGTVETVAMVYRAIELTRRVEGVRKVDDGALQARAW